MNKIGIVFGAEETFPGALVSAVNNRNLPDVSAESIALGGVRMDQTGGYRVILDRVSHEIPFYRAYLKDAVLAGASVINNPFVSGAGDKFFSHALAARMGLAAPRMVLLPHKERPNGTTDRSMRNLIFPLNWDEVLDYVGFPAYLKSCDTHRKHVRRVHSAEEFFNAYDQTGDLCMMLQSAAPAEQFIRCYVVGEQTRVMRYDPSAEGAPRYSNNSSGIDSRLHDQAVAEAQKLCRALGYEVNCVEFAVRDAGLCVIDPFNPVPDAEYHSLGPENFEWFVNAVAELTIAKAMQAAAPSPAPELHWSHFLTGNGGATAAKPRRKPAAPRKARAQKA